MFIRLALLLLVSAVCLPAGAQNPAGGTYVKQGYESGFTYGSEESGQKTTGTRYFLSTNVMNFTALWGNLALEVRYPNDFAFKVSVLGGYAPYPFSNRNTRMSVIGFHPEVRWYVNRNKSFYLGMSGNLIRVGHYERERTDTGRYVGDWYKTDNSVIVSFGGLIGYYLRLGYRFGLDFNVALGANYMPDSWLPFTLGLTQVGVSLSWEVGKNPPPKR